MIQNSNWIRKVVGTAALIIAGFMLWWQPIGVPLSPADPQYQEIAQVYRRSRETSASAACQSDPSHLSEVFANDLRGGPIRENYYQVLQYTQRSSSPILNYFHAGALDAEEAYIAWYSLAHPFYVDKIEKPTHEGRMYQMSDLDLVHEMEAASGFSAIGPNYCNYGSGYYDSDKILSINRAFDIAHVTVDYTIAIQEIALVKRSGKWYVIGRKTVKSFGLG
jgi:hypothetical protein